MDLSSLLDTADLAIVRSEGVIASDIHDGLRDTVRLARQKVAFLGEAFVVAFAGGTGSGKSSLINAIVGTEVADVGVIRPTTNASLAVIPDKPVADLAALLDELGVDRRVPHPGLQTSIIIDLPDFDSTEEANRAIAERVLPRVDAVVWVFDPEKYADRVIHSEFLSKLARYEDVFVFALNQTDRLNGHTEVVRTDLRELLVADGFAAAEVVTTVASGDDTDISELRRALSQRFESKRAVVVKLATDLRVLANEQWLAISRSGVPGFDAGFAAATFVLLGVEAEQAIRQAKEI